jgi:hypothetical protein
VPVLAAIKRRQAFGGLVNTNGKSVSTPLGYDGKGEIMDDSERYARLATHLNSKKAGPLVCPVCNAMESFEAKGTLVGPPSGTLSTDLPAPTEPPTSTDPRFNYAACTNCGYSIFFDAGALTLPE